MKPILPELNNNSSENLYIQLYKYLREEITSGRIVQGERLPSLRNLARELGISVTTVQLAYDQLVIEGYLESRPQSGYYVDYASPPAGSADDLLSIETYAHRMNGSGARESDGTIGSDMPGRRRKIVDVESFDFVKWRKCMSSVLGEDPGRLLSEADRQGEPELRKEIAGYVYSSRGVMCTPEQIVISAGTQQVTNHLARILRGIGIDLVCTEDPGYQPVQNIFRDRGFSMNLIPVESDGIVIEKLPVNIRSAVYVSPQNQFPTGAVMPAGRRHQLLEWAQANNSIIIEDDYNSELRYFGRPVPALQGMDGGSRVVYLGSFSSTLFPAIRISYMVLPEEMLGIYAGIRKNYDQTCSKTEQLTLARFMQSGYYQTNLRRVRRLYSRKLQEVMDTVAEIAALDAAEGRAPSAEAYNTQSGISVLLKLRSSGTGVSNELRVLEKAQELGLNAVRLPSLDQDGNICLALYYNQIPLADIPRLLRSLILE